MNKLRVLRASLLYAGRLYQRGDVIAAPVEPERIAAWIKNGVVTPHTETPHAPEKPKAEEHDSTATAPNEGTPSQKTKTAIGKAK